MINNDTELKVNNDNNDTLLNILTNLGIFMPSISFIYVLIYLYKNKRMNKYVILFIIMFIFNLILNQLLKSYFKQERPYNSGYNNKYLKNDNYGMPSGHAQSVAYSFSLLYLLTQDIKIMIIGIISVLITSTQRIYDNKHTQNQVLAGVIVGLVFALITGKGVISMID